MRARQRARRHRRRVHQPRDRGGRRGGVGAPRLRRRAGARGRVRVAAAQRHGLELRRQQLPAGQEAAGVRRPVLEPGRGAPRRRAAPRLRAARARQLAGARRRPRGARLAGRPPAASTSTATSSPGCNDHIVPWENAYASTQMLGGDEALRALEQRPHPGDGQPARRPTRARATALRTSTPTTRRRSSPRRPSCPVAGGPTTPTGLASARASCARRPSSSAARGRRALGKAPGTYVLAS